METLDKYFLYGDNGEPENIRETFINLDRQMKIIHSKGYRVDINSSSIINENGLSFSKYYEDLDEEERKNNIEDLSKLAVGTYFSIPTGTFSDYTHLPTDYIKDNFDVLETGILKANSDDNYYRSVLVDGEIGYYCDYLDNLKASKPQGKSSENGRVLAYFTPEGKAMSNTKDEGNESAFIDIVFYPIIITLTAIVSYMIYILVR